jgi:membrane protein YqaA with SNARE-associated domain
MVAAHPITFFPCLVSFATRLKGNPFRQYAGDRLANSYLYAYLPWVIALSFGPIVPDILSWAMASLILGSWLFAAIMMRRACRRRGSGKTKR